MSSVPFKVGIVGTGIFAKDGHLPIYQQIPEKLEVNAAYNRTKAKALDFAKAANIPENKVYDTLDEILADPEVDAIDALLPVQHNLLLVEKAIAAGKPVLLEKPLAATISDARKIVKLSEDTDVPIAIAENWHFLKSTTAIREKMLQIGDIVAFSYDGTGPFVASNKYLKTPWRRDSEHPYVFLSDGAVHQLAFLTDVLGDIKSVSALTRQVRETSNAQDVIFSTVTLESGAIGTFNYGSAFGKVEKCVILKIYGTNGSIKVDISNKRVSTIKVKIGSSVEAEEEDEDLEIDEGSFGIKDELLNLYDAISKKDKTVVKCPPRVAFHHLACVVAFLDSSSKNGNTVDVQYP